MLAEMADQRADMDTLLTIIQRLDAAIGGLLNEVPARMNGSSATAAGQSMHLTRSMSRGASNKGFVCRIIPGQ